MIYLASSWRNLHHPEALKILRAAGHEVYDFRNPTEGDNGFAWSAITDEPKPWTTETMREVLNHPVAQRGFGLDFDAMSRCSTCVLLLPCGRSAHLEAGWFIGAGRPVIVWGHQAEKHEPELMYLLATAIETTPRELLQRLQYVGEPRGGSR